MNLETLLGVLAAKEGVLHYYKTRSEHDNQLQTFMFWQEINSVIREATVRILVINPGEPIETAQAYDPNVLDIPVTPVPSSPFKDEVIAALPTYLGVHTEIEKVIFDNVDETNAIATLTTYEYDSGNDRTERKRKVVYKKGGVLTVRTLLASRELVNDYLKSTLGL